jgi:hypothetical protein
MKLSKSSIVPIVIGITVSVGMPAYAQRGKPAAPPAGASANHPAPHGNANASKPDTPPKPADFTQRIASHPQLASRLQALLPGNMTLSDAAAGFKNQGQFIAALHVSHNLNIPFDQLKTEMTGPDQLSLGQSIKKLKPAEDSTSAVSRAEREAKEDEKVIAQ